MSAKVLDDGYQYMDEITQNALKAMDSASLVEILKAGADELVKDVRALPQPRSNRTGYTHMLDSVTGQEESPKYLVGWGRYYGPIVEAGHKSRSGKMVPARAHLRKTYKDHMEKYQKAMQDKFNEIGGLK